MSGPNTTTEPTMPDGLPPPILLALPRKRWWRSRTLWFNALVAALTAAEMSLHVVQPLLGEHTYQVIAFVLAVGNAALRMVSTQALAVRGGPAQAEPS